MTERGQQPWLYNMHRMSSINSTTQSSKAFQIQMPTVMLHLAHKHPQSHSDCIIQIEKSTAVVECCLSRFLALFFGNQNPCHRQGQQHQATAKLRFTRKAILVEGWQKYGQFHLLLRGKTWNIWKRLKHWRKALQVTLDWLSPIVNPQPSWN